jgi:glycogen debranching enzyme
MVIAAAMDYTPLSREQQYSITELATQKLLTPKGLRTLSPDDPNFRGDVSGTPAERESAAHNGAVHPWLLQLYAELILKIHHKSGISPIKKIVEGFNEEMTANCLGTISEMYNGNPPYNGKGSISQAWNVASLLSCIQMIAQAEKSTT